MRKQLFRIMILSTLLFAFVTIVLPAPTWASTNWFTEQADNKTMAYPEGFGYDANGTPGILQMNFNDNEVIYRYKSASGVWFSEVIATGVYGSASLAYDIAGNPVALYLNRMNTTDEIFYATRGAGGSWSSERVATGTFIPYMVSLAFDSAGRPGFAYVDGNTLYYVAKSGASWVKQKVRTGDDIGNPSLAYNGTTPAIAFSDDDRGLQYTYRSGSSWIMQVVDSKLSTFYRGRQNFITLQFGNGRPLISYNDQVTKDLNFAYYLNGRWVTTILEKSVDSKNYMANYATMKVAQGVGNYTIYLLHSNCVTHSTSQIRLKTLSVQNDSSLTGLAFTTITLHTGKFGNMAPMLALGLEDRNPGIVFLRIGVGTTYVSMKPKIQVASSVSFGTIPSGGSATRQLTLTNSGSLPLSIASISGADPPFHITNSNIPTLAPGASHTLSLEFAPTSPSQTYTATLSIATNDPDRPTVGISLSGRSLGNDASLARVNFGNGITMTSFPDNEGSLVVPFATESLRISPVATDSNAQISLTCSTSGINNSTIPSGGLSTSISLPVGTTTSAILHITSEDQTTQKTYTLDIYRKDSPEAHLSNLSFSAGTMDPEFSPQVTNYSITLPDGVLDYSLTATAIHTGASIEVDSDDAVTGTAFVSSTAGVVENVHTIHVVAPDTETTMNYQVSLFRLPELSGITLDHGVLNSTFDPYVTSYSAIVPVTVTTVAITPSTSGAHASNILSINGTTIDSSSSASIPLVIGNNTITIGALSYDGKASRTYTLNIKRLEGISRLQVGVNPVLSSMEDFEPSVQIIEEEASIAYTLPEGMLVEVNGDLMEDGTFPTFAFSEGRNTPIKLELFSDQSTESAVYFLTVFRRPLLTSLKINGNDISLWPEESLSWHSVSGASTSAIIEATANAGSTIRSDGNYSYTTISANKWRVDNLQIGTNPLYLVVDSPDETTQTHHMLLLQRLPALTGLTVSEGALSPGFDPDIYEYTVNVPITTETISLTGEFSSEDPITGLWTPINMSVGDVLYSSGDATTPIALSYGSNPILIELITSDYTRAEYVVDVIRAEPAAAAISRPTSAAPTAYTATIPHTALTDPNGGSITIKADVASLTLPGDMLSNTGLTGTVGVSIKEGNKEDLSDDVRAAIGDRPLIQLTLFVDGKQIAWNNPKAPVTVRIPYSPTPEELANPEGIVIWFIDGFGHPVCVTNGRYDEETGAVVFQTTHFSYYAVVYRLLQFNDVAENAWYAPAVSFLSARGITEGTGDGQFSPMMKLTRGQFLVMLMKTYEIAPDHNSVNNFADAGDTYYTGFLASAKQMGVTSGVGNNRFAPNQQITRQEMFTLLYNTLKLIDRLPGGTFGQALEDFKDHEIISSWARDPISQLVKAGIINGSNGALSPLDSTTRAEMAQVLKNLLWN